MKRNKCAVRHKISVENFISEQILSRRGQNLAWNNILSTDIFSLPRVAEALAEAHGKIYS